MKRVDCAVNSASIPQYGVLRPPWGSVKLFSTKFTDFVPVEQFNHKPMGMYDGGHTFPYYTFVIELLHWHKVRELGEDKLHRPPMVALKMHSNK